MEVHHKGYEFRFFTDGGGYFWMRYGWDQVILLRSRRPSPRRSLWMLSLPGQGDGGMGVVTPGEVHEAPSNDIIEEAYQHWLNHLVVGAP